MESGARSSSPGQVTAPYSTRACANSAGSSSAANTPAFGDRTKPDTSTTPASPSAKSTRSRSPGRTFTPTTRQGDRGVSCEAKAAGECSPEFDSVRIVPNRLSIRSDVVPPIPAPMPSPDWAILHELHSTSECRPAPRTQRRARGSEAGHDPQSTSELESHRIC